MLVQYHEIGEDVEAIVSAADISGPVFPCDSSLLLMTHLIHVRVMEVPGASLMASHHVIRWLSSRWDPGTRSIPEILHTETNPNKWTERLQHDMYPMSSLTISPA